ncbi:MAG: hypothetical protein Q9170_004233 [Blastenia crenularia]
MSNFMPDDGMFGLREITALDPAMKRLESQLRDLAFGHNQPNIGQQQRKLCGSDRDNQSKYLPESVGGRGSISRMAPRTRNTRLHLFGRDKLDKRTTNLILGILIPLCFFIVPFGLYIVYQMYMRHFSPRENHSRRPQRTTNRQPSTAAPNGGIQMTRMDQRTANTAGNPYSGHVLQGPRHQVVITSDNTYRNSWPRMSQRTTRARRANRNSWRAAHPRRNSPPTYPAQVYFTERHASKGMAETTQRPPTPSPVPIRMQQQTEAPLATTSPVLHPEPNVIEHTPSSPYTASSGVGSDGSDIISSLDGALDATLYIDKPTMWNDEDNNPYGSFDRRGSSSPERHPSNHEQSAFERPMTPTSETSSPTNEPPELISRPRDLSDDEEDHYTQQQSGQMQRKKGGYDSRIEQILYEHPDLQIVITDAGKSHESGGSYIVYTIRTGDLEVRRRYSEFHSLRSTLVNLHPTLIIPPIPEKHSMADYAAKPTKAKEDVSIIDLRKRMLTMFLNRCRKMREVREDGVWWRFLDPNSSWSEVLHSHPVASIPKSIMRAPPLDPSNPSPAHQWLPIPSASAKLRSVSRASSTGTPTSPPTQSFMASAAAHTIPAAQLYGRFPPSSQNLSEQELDPYFNNFETNTRDLELLLQGSIEKVNRRTLTHLTTLSTDMAELGARYNGFSLSEQSATVAAAIERIGQAVDSSYIATEELSSSLGANFAEPMRESAQFAGVVRSVLRYRIMKRIQEEMTKDELYTKKNLLESLERSETEAKRIEQYLSGSTMASSTPKRSTSSASARSTRSETAPSTRREGSHEDADSVDSDFPTTHSNDPVSPPSSSQGPADQDPGSPTRNHRKSPSGGFVANKIFGRISHAIHGVVDVDPERTRRDTIGKTKESLVQLEQALEVSEKDVKDASAGVLRDLKRFQLEKEDDLKRYMLAYARCHVHWAKRNAETWREAKAEVNKIDVR